MEKNKLNNATKKLIHLVKARKTQVVIYEHGSLKNSSRKSSSGSFITESYSEDFYE